MVNLSMLIEGVQAYDAGGEGVTGANHFVLGETEHADHNEISRMYSIPKGETVILPDPVMVGTKKAKTSHVSMRESATCHLTRNRKEPSSNNR